MRGKHFLLLLKMFITQKNMYYGKLLHMITDIYLILRDGPAIRGFSVNLVRKPAV